MLWSGATDTNAVWGVDEWAGRIRKEDAEPTIATAPLQIPSSVAQSVTDVTITESVTESVAGDSFSATGDNSTTTNSNTFSQTPITQTAISENPEISRSIIEAKNVLAQSAAVTVGNTVQSPTAVIGNIGESIGEPRIAPVLAAPSVNIGLSSAASIDDSQPVPAVSTKLASDESTFLDIDGVVQPATASTIFSDEISTVGDTAKLSVSASSSPVTISEATASELLSIQVSAVTTTNSIANTDDKTRSVSNDINSIAVTDSFTETSTNSTRSIDSSDTILADSLIRESFEIYSAIEDALLVTTASEPIHTRNLLTVSADAIISAVPVALISESQQINSSIDYTEIENETNIVTLEPSTNEVIIDE